MLNRKVRYRVITDFIKRHNPESVCEIGSGSQGMARYMKDIPFTGVDMDFSDYSIEEKESPALMEVVRADARHLPFADRTFDLVFSLDMIEHVSPQDRLLVMSEMVRVSGKTTIIAFPCGDVAFESDRRLGERLRQSGQKLPGWLREHLEHPFLRPNEADEIVGSLGCSFSAFGNESITVHNAIQFAESVTLGYSNLDQLVPFAVFRKLDEWSSNFYRRVYVIDRK